jgi:hypothetical protein
MCTEPPGGQTVACLQLIWDKPSVQDYWWAEGGLKFALMNSIRFLL